MSEAGNLWRGFYEKKVITWCEPEKITYEQLERFSRSEWIDSLLKWISGEKKDAKILEAGCGLGLYAMSLAIRGYQKIEAFDYNVKAVEIAESIKKNLKRQCLDVRFFQNDLLNIQIPDKTYDFVFNQAVLEYFRDENEKCRAINEMVRVAKPGGKIAVIVQHTKHPLQGYWIWRGWKGYIDQPPVAEWSRKSLKESLLSAGLTDIQISGLQPAKAIFFWPPVQFKSRLSQKLLYLAGRFFEKLPYPDWFRVRFGMQLIGIGTKP